MDLGVEPATKGRVDSRLVGIVELLLYLQAAVLVFSFFSPALPRLDVPFSSLKGEFLALFLALVLLYAVLEKRKIIETWLSGAIPMWLRLFVAALSLQLLTRVPFLVHYQASLNSDKSVTLLMIRNITAGSSYPIYFYGQLYQGSLNAYLYSMIHALVVAPLALSVLIGNALFLSIAVLFGSALINRLTSSTSFFYPFVVLSLPVGALLFFSTDQIHGFALVVALQAVLMYLVFRSVFESRELFFSIGLIGGALFWSYQPALPLIAVSIAWLAASLVWARRFRVLGRASYRTLGGFFLGALPHLLSEINNGLINTKSLFLRPGLMDSLSFEEAVDLGRASLGALLKLDSGALAAYVLLFLSLCGLWISFYRAIKGRDLKWLYIPSHLGFGVAVLLVSGFPPVERYVAHYRLYGFFPLILIAVACKEMAITERRAVKALAVIFLTVFTTYRSMDVYGGLRASHLENEATIAGLENKDERIVLGSYWNSIKFAPFVDEETVMTSAPSLTRPGGIFAFSKHYDLALRLGERWDAEDKRLIVRSHEKGRVNELLGSLGITSASDALGGYFVYSGFSESLSPELYAILAGRPEKTDLEFDYGSLARLRQRLAGLPEPVLEAGSIVVPTLGIEDVQSGGQKKGWLRGWRYVLRKGKEEISFPLQASGKQRRYWLPRSMGLHPGEYHRYVYFLNHPVHSYGRMEIAADLQSAALTISDVRDRVRFFGPGKSRPRRGLPINGLELTVLDEKVSSIELRIYSFFDFGSSLWANRYTQLLLLNGEEIPLRYGQNTIVRPVPKQGRIHLDTKYKTLLFARDTQRNVEFHNTGGALEKIIVHGVGFSYQVVPFLREGRRR